MKTDKFFWGYFFVFLILSSCKFNDKKNEENNVNVHLNADVVTLNPVSYHDANSEIVIDNVFQYLLNIDRKTLELVPVLALSRPQIEKTLEGGLLFKYKLRPEARWDNGKQITAKDVEFSLKLILTPGINDFGKKSFYDFITDFKFDEEDPLSFTLISNQTYMLAEAASGTFPILPAYIYDSGEILKKFSLKNIISDTNIAQDSRIIQFTQEFNAEKYQREPQFISGSGAYKLESWNTGQQIIIKKKENWWGDLLENENTYFEAKPDKISFLVIPDQNTTLTALKNNKIDITSNIKSKDFIDLKNNNKLNNNYNFFEPLQYEYNYIGLNNVKGIFIDKNVRVAFASLINIPKIIEIIYYGKATQITGPIHPSKEKVFNTEIKPYDFDPKKTVSLLKNIGWVDIDNNGILDKEINGKKIQLELNLGFNNGNEERKLMAILIQEEAKKAGIKINLQNYEGSIYLDMIRKHEFDLFIGSMGTSPFPDDLKNSYHTTSIQNSINFTGFGTPESDSLIDAIRVEMDEDKRIEPLIRLQEIIHEEACTLYLFARSNHIVINKKFANDVTSSIRPGYWAAGLFKD